jgi:hypothetical protein
LIGLVEEVVEADVAGRGCRCGGKSDLVPSAAGVESVLIRLRLLAVPLNAWDFLPAGLVRNAGLATCACQTAMLARQYKTVAVSHHAARSVVMDCNAFDGGCRRSRGRLFTPALQQALSQRKEGIW